VANHGRVGLRSWAAYRLRHDLSNWRLFLVRAVTGGLAVVVTVVLVPGLRFTSWRFGEFVLVSVVFGLLNAIVKPVLQFFALRYLVATYGLVVVVINALLLLLLASVLGDALAVQGLLAVLLGGLVVGVLGLAFDTLAGATPPIVDRPRGPTPDEGTGVPRPAPAAAPASWDDVPTGTRWYEVSAAPSDDLVVSQAAAVLAGFDPDDAVQADPPEGEVRWSPEPEGAALAEPAAADVSATDAPAEEGEQ
jgi:putative membrane protein